MKTLKDLIPGDYVFSLNHKRAIKILPEYESRMFTCSLDAITKFPDSYRIATDKEIDESILYIQEYKENMRKIIEEIFKDDE
jgi:hypothetical protein